MEGNDEIRCPRCGAFLVRGFTAAHKVCMDCPDCHGRLITLPVLKDGLGVAGVSALSRAVRESPNAGCRCPACGNTMGLLKVGVDGHKVEIDVCASCLSVWCDNGEFEKLVPVLKQAPVDDFHSIAKRASPAAQERLAKAMLEQIPEDVDMGAYTMGEVAGDLVYLIVGAPTLWKKVGPTGPIISILICLGLPVFQLVFYYVFHEYCRAAPYSFWNADPAMVSSVGFAFPGSLLSWFAHPFLQSGGRSATTLAVSLFPVLAVVERRSGCVRFIGLYVALWITSMVVHSVQTVFSSAGRPLYGICPIALGFCAYLWSAYPEARINLRVFPKG